MTSSLSKTDPTIRPSPLSPDVVLWVTLGVGILSFAAGLINVFSVRQAADVVARGEGESLLAALDNQRRNQRRRMEAADLEGFASDHPQVSYVALLRPNGKPVVRWGNSSFQQTPPRGRDLARIGTTYRVTDLRAGRREPPGPRTGPDGVRRPPEDINRPRPGGPPRGPGSPPEVSWQIEFEPIVVGQLTARARLSLLINLVIALLFVGAAFLLRKLLRDRELAERKSFEEERLRSLGEMSGVLAHELRNPLASLKGHAQLLAEGLDGSDGKRAERLVREVGRLERLCADLLEFVRTGPLDLREVAVKTVLEEALAATKDPERVELSADEDIRWTLDAGRIQEALANLLRNALRVAPTDLVELRATADDEALTLEVLDRGPGVAMDDRERIFQPFFTTKTEGTGLGLAVARRTTEMHGGSIRCEPREDGGTRFLIALPSSQPARQPFQAKDHFQEDGENRS